MTIHSRLGSTPARSGGRELLGYNSWIVSQVFFDWFRSVNAVFIPEQCDWTVQELMDVGNEPRHPLPSEVGVVIQKMEVKSEFEGLPSQCHCSDGGDSLMGFTDLNSRRLAARSPSTPECRCKHEACLIDEDNVRASAVCHGMSNNILIWKSVFSRLSVARLMHSLLLQLGVLRPLFRS